MYYTTGEAEDRVWHLYDPDGEWIASVMTEGEANSLVNHLNKGTSWQIKRDSLSLGAEPKTLCW